MIITFIGHGSLYDRDNILFEKIKNAILKNIKSQEQTLFYCGGYGDFDNLCAKASRSIAEQNTNCEVVFVTPYITEAQQKKIKFFIDAKIYDSAVYPPLENIHPKFAISRRNKWMIEQADLIIAYVDHTYGGAYKTLEYAYKRQKNIINLAEL